MEAKCSVKRIGPVVYQLTGDDKIEKGYLTNCLIIPRDDQPIATVRLDGTVIAMLDGYAIVPREEYEVVAQQQEAEARVAELEAALRAAYVILEGLRLAVEWELAPTIKTEIARVASLIGPLLTRGRAKG